MQLVCCETLAQRTATSELLEPYLNSMGIVYELEQGFLLEKQTVQNGLWTIIPSPLFYDMQPHLMMELKKKIHPPLSQYERLQSSERQLVCRSCKKTRTESEASFVSVFCDCNHPTIVPVEADMQVVARCRQVDWLVVESIRRRREIELEEQQLEQQEAEEERERRESQRALPSTREYDQLVRELKKEIYHNTKGRLSKPLEMTPERMELAYASYAPKSSYRKVERMVEVRAQRQLKMMQ